MSEPIGSMRADLRAGAARFETDMKQARNAARKASTSMTANFKKVTKQSIKLARSIVSVRTAVSAAAGATGLFLLSRRSIEAADAIAKTADKLGLSVETLQEYRFAAEKAGVATNTFDMAFQRFTRRSAEAAQGTGEAKDALKSLGVTIEDLRNKSPEALFRQTADALARVEDPAQRLRLAFKLFDSEGVALVNMLEDGSAGFDAVASQARALGIVLSNDTVRAAEQANDELTTMSKVLSVSATALGLDFIPVMSQLTGIITSEGFRTGFREWRDNLVDAIDWMVRHKDTISTVSGALFGAAVGARGGPWGALGGALFGAGAGNGAFTNEIDVVKDRLRDVKAQIALIESSSAALPGIELPTSKNLLRELEEDLRILEARKAFLEAPDVAPSSGGATGGLAGNLDLTATAVSGLTSAISLQNLEFSQLIGRYREGATNVTAFKDQLELENAAKQANIDLSSTQGRAWQAEFQQRQQLARTVADLERVTTETLTAQEKFNAEVARLDELKPHLTADQYTRALANARDELDKGDEAAKRNAETARELGLTFSSAFEDAIVNGGKLRDIVKGLTADLARMFVRKSFTEPAADMFSSLLSGGFGGFFAAGGDPPVGIPSVVGENGPEVFVPRQSGTIVPNHLLGGGGTSVHAEIHVNAQNSAFGVEQAVEAVLDSKMPQMVEMVAGAMMGKQSRNQLGGKFK